MLTIVNNKNGADLTWGRFDFGPIWFGADLTCFQGTDHLTWRGWGGGLWFFVSFRKLFSDNTRVRILFFCHAKRNFFFQNLTLGCMTKTLNQIIFFFLHQNQNIFFSNNGNQNIILEKNHTPHPLQVKWSFLTIPSAKYERQYFISQNIPECLGFLGCFFY